LRTASSIAAKLPRPVQCRGAPSFAARRPSAAVRSLSRNNTDAPRCGMIGAGVQLDTDSSETSATLGEN
jgi:hypothetical protein